MAVSCLFALQAEATIEGSLDPESVVSEWSDSTTYDKIIDINFSDSSWPDVWAGTTGRDCPSYDEGGYVNAIIEVEANGGETITYPVNFHNCTFATKESYNGYAGATAAFCRQYYVGESYVGNSSSTYNNWTVSGHTTYLEDNIEYGTDGNPIYGEAGFVQMCRDASDSDESLHGWMEIDHLPYIERIQWSWSSTSWGRGIKCDIKIGDSDWEPLVWMGSNKQKVGYTVFSDQGYFMENVIDAQDVSLRWRVWDGDTIVQVDSEGNSVFATAITPLAQHQAPRVHKIRIFGNEITEEDAQYARENPVNDVGDLSDLGDDDTSDSDEAPDADAPIQLIVVAQDGTGDYTSVQDAIDAVEDGNRGIIYIRPGVYDENIYAGTKDDTGKYISLIGEDAETTILTSSIDRGDDSDTQYYDCAALNVYVSRFYAQNLTIRNTSGDVGQAEALFTSGDAHTFNSCIISGYQDTYKSNVDSRGYFYNCTIIGATDFIYDSGLEWFEECEISCLEGGGYITAAGDAGLIMTNVLYPKLSTSTFYAGLFFRGCQITAEDGVSSGSYYLGRPWKEGCGTMFIQCTLGDHINEAGWNSWDGNEDNCSYAEYLNEDEDGELIDTSSRASFSYQATQEEIEAYMTPEYLFGIMSDVPFDYATILGGAAEPQNFTIDDGGFSWESDDMAVGFLIYKDGAFVAFTEETSYSTEMDDESVYSVRSVSKHGVMSSEAVVEETADLLAFPTAEGFGKFASGGRGGQVVTVTSLEDDADVEGTLRWAFNQYEDEPLTIVFAVSGEIVLEEELKVSRSDWTLAGQTAPGDGIVITHNKVNFGGSENFIVRNMRFRIGQNDTDGNIIAENALGAENCSNYIFDHCSFGWSVEENINTADSHFLTVQYSIVHEGLYNAGHSKGARGYGSQWGGSPATYYHNLLAHNKSRSPRFNGARGEDYVVFLEYINNVNYNFGGTSGCYGGENTADITTYNGLNSAHECNFINNYYKPGPASATTGYIFFTSSYARDGATSWGPAKWYVDGNIIEGDDEANEDNWSAVAVETYTLDDIKVSERIVTETPYYKYSVVGNSGTYIPENYMIYDFETAEEAYNTVIEEAGTINRDDVESRIASEAANGTYTYTGSVSGLYGIIDLETDAEGFYSYSSDYDVPTDSDGDGMPDEWETSNGLDPYTADQNTLNSDGYTALEVWLNSLMGETLESDFTDGITYIEPTSPTISYDSENGILVVGDESIGATLRIFSTDGRLLSQSKIISSRQEVSGSGPRLLMVSGKGLRTRVIKAIK